MTVRTALPDAGPEGWLRWPFELGPWASTADPDWQAAYDAALVEHAEDGPVLGVLLPELAPAPLADRLEADAEAEEAEAWIDAWVAEAAAVVARYAARIPAFEVLPAPYRGGTGGPAIAPVWQARALAGLRAACAEGVAGAARLLASLPPGEDPVAARAALLSAGRAEEGGPPPEGFAIRPDLAAFAEGEDPFAALLDALGEDAPPVLVTGFAWRGGNDDLLYDAALAGARAAIEASPVLELAARGARDLYPQGVGSADGAGRDDADERPLFELQSPLPWGPSRAEGATPPPVDGFDFPVGAPDAKGCFNAAGVADDYYYQHFGHVWHPGEDWNKGSGDADLGEPITAIAHGVVTFAQYVASSWGNLVLVRHDLPDGSRVWSQYAHLNELRVAEGDMVLRGQELGTMGKGANNRFASHLHFEIRSKPLRATNWFPMVRDKAQVMAHYEIPTEFIGARRPDAFDPDAVVVVVDDTDPGFARADVPHWHDSSVGFGSGAIYTYAAEKDEANSATWTATLPEPGRYAVSAFVPRTHATTEAARYAVTHAAGRTVARVNQREHSDEWVPLGTFRFGRTGEVWLTDVTGEADRLKRKVCFDAIRWIAQG